VAIAAQDLPGVRIYLLGFDMGATESGRFNNLFADTEHYKASGSSPTFTGNWIRQLITVMRDCADHQFVRVHGATTAQIAEFDSVRNLHSITMSEFLQRINTPKDL
jgi:hypothetical protein